VSGPVFIIGAMRSGTTALRLALDAHPDLAIPEETAFMAGGAALLRIPGWRYGDVWFERIDADRADVAAGLRQLYDDLFGSYARRRGATRWGEKTPLHVFLVEELAEVFPDASFVGLVRHPSAVVASMVSSWRREPIGAAGYWRRATTELARVGSALGDDRFVLVRYEDLVRQPEEVLRDVCAACRLPWDDRVLRHDEVQDERGAPTRTDGATEVRRPLDTAGLSSWEARLDGPVLDAVRRETEGVATWLGYRAEDPLPEPWTDGSGSRWSLRSSDLVRMAAAHGAPELVRQHEDPLDLDADPRELAERAARAERQLENLRRRRAVRAVDAIRAAQRRGVRAAVRGWLSRRGG
jgi:hypothetical protein